MQEEALTDLNKIKDEQLVQKGLIGDYLPFILKIAHQVLDKSNYKKPDEDEP